MNRSGVSTPDFMPSWPSRPASCEGRFDEYLGRAAGDSSLGSLGDVDSAVFDDILERAILAKRRLTSRLYLLVDIKAFLFLLFRGFVSFLILHLFSSLLGLSFALVVRFLDERVLPILCFPFTRL